MCSGQGSSWGTAASSPSGRIDGGFTDRCRAEVNDERAVVASPARLRPILNNTGPISSLIATPPMIKVSSERPISPKLLPTIAARRIETPAWETKPIQPNVRVASSALPSLAPAFVPVYIANARTATSPSANNATCRSSSRWSFAPASVKKTT
jgi:hypothetical protein